MPKADGWITCGFISFSTVSKSYQGDERVIMKGCVQCNSVLQLKTLPPPKLAVQCLTDSATVTPIAIKNYKITSCSMGNLGSQQYQKEVCVIGFDI